jgi:tRNA-Thr(GGU) m(6)t(6)A37 methyltransferase TsaA
MNPIAYITTPYKQKFAIPRQPGIVKSAIGIIQFEPDYAIAESVRELQTFSHLWLIFQFHKTHEQGWNPLVRPPRLGGNKKVGVFATRSTFRPNSLGLSVCELLSVETASNQVSLTVRGMDLLDQTPILDIKPYLPYADNIPDATTSFASNVPENTLSVEFDNSVLEKLQEPQLTKINLKQLIIETLQQDPRPAYKANKPDPKQYSMQLYDYDILWHVKQSTIYVNQIITLNPS